MRNMQRVALALTIIGALNWGITGFFQFDVVAQLAGGSSETLARLIYIVIGVSGLTTLSLLFEGWRGRDEVNSRASEAEEI